jgi:Tfp pilus assembly protein PilO
MMDALFEKIDAYFNAKKSSEATIIMLFGAVIVAYFVYLVSFEPAERFFVKSKRSYVQLEKKYNSELQYANSITVNGDKEFRIKRLSSDIEQAKIDLERIAYANEYVDDKLKELSYLLFNDKNWANFLDNLAKLAQDNNVELVTISNEFKEPSLQKIEQILTVSLELKGRYKDILKFINSVEESRLVVDLYELDISSAQPLNGEIKIAVWGMKY